MSKEESVTISNEGHQLAGTLCHPTGAASGISILLIAGSGQHDRNQNSKKFKLNLFNTLAEQLASAGIHTLRYDKRGCGDSEGEYAAVGHTDLVSDARAWLNYMTSRLDDTSQITCVLGHSEGTIICPQIAADRKAVNGQILLAPFLEPLQAVTERQARQTLETITTLPGVYGKFIRLILRLQGDQLVKQRKHFQRARESKKPFFRKGFRKVNAKWLREIAALNPVKIHISVSLPTLAVAGEKDLQCLPTDADRLRELLPETVTAITIPDMTHILRADFNEPSLMSYSSLIKQPIDSRIVESILAWLDNTACFRRK
ncbi:MAG: alpha/beta fold hydrolase [Granulosicoccus sp.]